MSECELQISKYRRRKYETKTKSKDDTQIEKTDRLRKEILNYDKTICKALK